MLDDIYAGSNKLLLLAQIKCWMTPEFTPLKEINDNDIIDQMRELRNFWRMGKDEPARMRGVGKEAEIIAARRMKFARRRTIQRD